jgi:hypothetical protein
MQSIVAPSGVVFDMTRGLDEASMRFIPGGNIIIVSKDLCIVGNDSVYYLPCIIDAGTLAQLGPQAHAKAQASYPALEGAPSLQVALWRGRNDAKREIADLIGARKVAVSSKWLFHADEQMTLVSHSHLLLHSFNEALSFLTEYKARLLLDIGADDYEYLFRATEILAKTYEPLIERDYLKFTKAGLTVVKGCFMLIGSVEDGIATSRKTRAVFDA